MMGYIRRQLMGRSVSVFVISQGCCLHAWNELLFTLGTEVQKKINLVEDASSADLLIVMGPLTDNNVELIKKEQAGMLQPCWTLAIGPCIEIFCNIKKGMMFDFFIPGCPTQGGLSQSLEKIFRIIADRAGGRS